MSIFFGGSEFVSQAKDNGRFPIERRCKDRPKFPAQILGNGVRQDSTIDNFRLATSSDPALFRGLSKRWKRWFLASGRLWEWTDMFGDHFSDAWALFS